MTGIGNEGILKNVKYVGENSIWLKYQSQILRLGGIIV